MISICIPKLFILVSVIKNNDDNNELNATK